MKMPGEFDGLMSAALNALVLILMAAVILRLIYEALAPLLPWLVVAIGVALIWRVSYSLYTWWRERY